jgi:hypothetical protein
LAIILTDWPLAVLSHFWAAHAVISAVLSTLLIAGIGFLAFKARDARIQSELDNSVTAAGMGGVVDYAVDVEVALALASRPHEPDSEYWGDWSRPSRPLRWLRDRCDALSCSETGGPSTEDPRGDKPPTELTPHADHHWRIELLDQSVRRIIVAVRDWGPVLGRSRKGQAVLVELGTLRNDLLDVEAKLRDQRQSSALESMICLRRRCRIMALALERGSGSKSERQQVLTTIEPLSVDTRRMARWARLRSNLERGTWKRQFDDAYKELIAGQSNSAVVFGPEAMT